MKQNKIGRYVILAAVGFLIFAAGLAMVWIFEDADGIQQTLPYICVGVGAGLFGGNLGTALRNRAMLTNPQAVKQQEIEQKDERNQMIRYKAKARVYDLMTYVYAAILLAFTLMDVDLYVSLTLVAVYLFFIFANIHYLKKYNKEM